MKNVMWKGQLQATINIDTIIKKQNLCGLGPVEYLRGEVMIIDGKCYKSEVINDSIKVSETYNLKAPFFGYTNVEKWEEVESLPIIITLEQLEKFINKSSKKHKRPFFFKILAIVDTANIHVMDLPLGTVVTSPDIAHASGQKKFIITNKEVEIIGFFSTEHKSILTHHDTFMHLHLITKDKNQMGHLDSVFFKNATIKLYFQ
ncbi:MAG: acetolactate decarboxylase [Bacteroidia bacterium]|nr:acetolactate decarboxylase [Bacteroidia bacterium]